MSENSNEMQDASSMTDASDASEINDLREGQETQEASESQDAFGDQPALDIDLIKQVLETALLTSPEPLSLNDMKRMFPRGETNNELVRKLLDEIRASWEGRGVELVNVASGWRFRAKPELQRFLDKLSPQKAPKYSRAVMETLAIIAYRQPVTRGDIEDIRGVVVSSNIMKALEARGWIDVIGHREVPGRPAIFATTKQFLDDLSLRSLEELPALDDLGALVDSSGASQVELNMPEQGSGAISAAEGMLDDGDEPDDELSLTGDDEPVADAAIMPPSTQIH
jgi:segregation and condensation protein B